jgi:hypothetical protein
LPSKFDGADLATLSRTGGDIIDGDPILVAIVTELAIDPADLSMSMAAGPVSFLALRFKGADSSRLFEAWTAAAQKTSAACLSMVKVASKNVVKIQHGSISYTYVYGDVLLSVTAGSDAIARKGLALLP